VKVTSAATALHEVLAFALADPGNGILISRPMYGRFELDFGNKAQVRIINPDTTAADSFTEQAVDQYEKAIESADLDGIKVRALLIVNPHNPLGTISFPN
jgi:bifunctional pyridoxal-dependent enzyme with beta-cystathionase and maltose regulon repressor activities